MKFGKGILKEILQSNPEWAPFWLNYKNLKKRIKAVAKVPGHHAASQRDISESELEVAFFRDLQKELKKISLFYASEEKRCHFRFHQLRAVLKDLKKQSRIDAFEAQRLMFAFVHFYRECIRLENFAVMNYQGFSKILKKHDKMTGYNTRSKYMRRKVNLSTFSNYPLLLQILENTEEMFHEVERDVRMATAVSNIKLDFSPTMNPDPFGSVDTPTHMASSSMYQTASPTLTPSNTLAPTPRFPASVLWSSEDQEHSHYALGVKHVL
uniref:SPX domain-containing protein n=1 Tax=Globisporangium ultimum (strain ATCC 200006 / CBS 805.95 / DAOM BR144) TaxID=431595 RepID=K3W7B8_GLOUD